MTDAKYREHVKAYNRESHKKHGRRRRLAAYGITPAQWDAMFAIQDNCCAVCLRENPGGTGWCIDHCHATGAVRGILCHACNRALGNLGDSPETLRRAISYLERHSMPR